MKKIILLLITSLFLTACSPHPGSGVWQAIEANDDGIEKLIVGFEGKAEFISTQKNNTLWHCFWTAYDKQTLNLNCSPSTDSEEKTSFYLIVDDQGVARLQHKTVVHATFKRLDENPVIGEQ